MSLAEVLRVAIQEWRMLAAVLAVCTLGAVAYALLATPMYRAEIVVVDVDPGGDGQPLAGGLLGQLGGIGARAGLGGPRFGAGYARGLALLTSHAFVREFIERNDLLPALFPKASEDNPPTMWDAVIRFKRHHYSVSLDKESGLTTLSILWTDAGVAAKWANAAITLANEIAREQDKSDAERSIRYLEEQIRSTNVVELQRVLYNLVEAEQRKLMLANARPGYLFHVVDPAVAPMLRAKPHRKLVVIIGFVIGLLLGPCLVAGRRVIASLK